MSSWDEEACDCALLAWRSPEALRDEDHICGRAYRNGGPYARPRHRRRVAWAVVYLVLVACALVAYVLRHG